MDARQGPWKPSQPAMKSHVSSRGRPRSLNVIRGREVSRAWTLTSGTSNRSGAPVARRASIRSLHHLVLSVDRDRAAAGQRGEVDMVPGTGECDVDTVVPQALAPKPLAHAGLCQQIHGALLEHAGPHPFDRRVLRGGARGSPSRSPAGAAGARASGRPGRRRRCRPGCGLEWRMRSCECPAVTVLRKSCARANGDVAREQGRIT